jgi:hypothetical protein
MRTITDKTGIVYAFWSIPGLMVFFSRMFGRKGE